MDETYKKRKKIDVEVGDLGDDELVAGRTTRIEGGTVCWSLVSTSRVQEGVGIRPT